MKKITKKVLWIDAAIFCSIAIIIPPIVVVPYCSTTLTSCLEKKSNRGFDISKDDGAHPSPKEMLFAFLYGLYIENTKYETNDTLKYNLMDSEFHYTAYTDTTSAQAKCYTYSDSIKINYAPLEFKGKLFYSKDATFEYDSASGTWDIAFVEGGLTFPYPEFDNNGKLIHLNIENN